MPVSILWVIETVSFDLCFLRAYNEQLTQTQSKCLFQRYRPICSQANNLPWVLNILVHFLWNTMSVCISPKWCREGSRSLTCQWLLLHATQTVKWGGWAEKGMHCVWRTSINYQAQNHLFFFISSFIRSLNSFIHLKMGGHDHSAVSNRSLWTLRHLHGNMVKSHTYLWVKGAR